MYYTTPYSTVLHSAVLYRHCSVPARALKKRREARVESLSRRSVSTIPGDRLWTAIEVTPGHSHRSTVTTMTTVVLQNRPCTVYLGANRNLMCQNSK